MASLTLGEFLASLVALVIFTTAIAVWVSKVGIDKIGQLTRSANETLTVTIADKLRINSLESQQGTEGLRASMAAVQVEMTNLLDYIKKVELDQDNTEKRVSVIENQIHSIKGEQRGLLAGRWKHDS